MSKVDQIEQKEIQLILGFRLLKLMEAAQYFVVDDTPPQEWRHYALDFDVYTHFTSPIRRYPDILVLFIYITQTLFKINLQYIEDYNMHLKNKKLIKLEKLEINQKLLCNIVMIANQMQEE